MEALYTKPGKADFLGKVLRRCVALSGLVAVLCFTINAEAGRNSTGHGGFWTGDVSPITTCDAEGIGKANLFADAPATIEDVSEQVTPNGVD